MMDRMRFVGVIVEWEGAVGHVRYVDAMEGVMPVQGLLSALQGSLPLM